MRRCRLAIVFLALMVSTLAIHSAAMAADSAALQRILESGQLRVGMSGNQPPMNVKSRTGAFIGLEVDLANQLADMMGVKLTMVPTPFPELLPSLASGDVDIVMSNMSITPQRAIDVTFVGPYMLSGSSILTKSANLARFQNSAAINEGEVKVVALANSTSARFVERTMKKVTLETTSDYDTAVQMVIDGQADAMVADMTICVLSVMRNPDSDLTTLKSPLKTEAIGIAVAAGDQQFANLVDNYLETLEGVGVLDRLRKKWLEDDSWVSSLP